MSKFSTEQINNMVENALSTLKKDRDREVLRRRGGINMPAQTLEEIGQDLSITRERVRQIEKAALTKLQDQNDNSNDFSDTLLPLISKKGGLISLNSILEAIEAQEDIKSHAIFLIKINPELIYIEKNDNHAVLIATSQNFNENKVRKLHDEIVEVIKKLSKPSKFDQITKLIDGPHSEETLQELAKSSNHIGELDGLWGLNTWPEVNPKSIRDKIYLVLKRAGRPMHFSDIADKISSLAANPKRVTTQAVHNELIKDKRFVLIGRGIYALQEWGYRSGTVADIIEEVLKEEGVPISKDEIVKRVLARRQVKTTTIVLNLQEKPQFKRVEKGVYTLANS
jgi:hypothetical protein